MRAPCAYYAAEGLRTRTLMRRGAEKEIADIFLSRANARYGFDCRVGPLRKIFSARANNVAAPIQSIGFRPAVDGEDIERLPRRRTVEFTTSPKARP